MTAPCCDLHNQPSCCDAFDCGPCCGDCPTCPSLIRQRQPGGPISWRHRLANQLVGGELLALRANEVSSRRLAEQLRVANGEERARRREALARMRQALVLDVTRERQMRAVVLLGALLHRFRRDPDRQVLIAEASQTQLDRWAAIHEDLSGARDNDGPVTDREPTPDTRPCTPGDPA